MHALANCARAAKVHGMKQWIHGDLVYVCCFFQDAQAALEWLAAFHALWWEEVSTGANTSAYCLF